MFYRIAPRSVILLSSSWQQNHYIFFLLGIFLFLSFYLLSLFYHLLLFLLLNLLFWSIILVINFSRFSFLFFSFTLLLPLFLIVLQQGLQNNYHFFLFIILLAGCLLFIFIYLLFSTVINSFLFLLLPNKNVSSFETYLKFYLKLYNKTFFYYATKLDI